MKTKIIAVAFLLAGAASPTIASDSTVEQFYANSGQPFSYFGMVPSALGSGTQDAFAQAIGSKSSGPRFETLEGRAPISLQTQRWYDRQSERY